jgi:hypothetical protein
VAAWVAATGASNKLAQTQAWVTRSITPAPILRIDVSPSNFLAAAAPGVLLIRRKYKGLRADHQHYTFLLKIL